MPPAAPSSSWIVVPGVIAPLLRFSASSRTPYWSSTAVAATYASVASCPDRSPPDPASIDVAVATVAPVNTARPEVGSLRGEARADARIAHRQHAITKAARDIAAERITDAITTISSRHVRASAPDRRSSASRVSGRVTNPATRTSRSGRTRKRAPASSRARSRMKTPIRICRRMPPRS